MTGAIKYDRCIACRDPYLKDRQPPTISEVEFGQNCRHQQVMCWECFQTMVRKNPNNIISRACTLCQEPYKIRDSRFLAEEAAAVVVPAVGARGGAVLAAGAVVAGAVLIVTAAAVGPLGAAEAVIAAGTAAREVGAVIAAGTTLAIANLAKRIFLDPQ